VVVVGAGPAGSSTARYAARRGLRVLLLEKRREVGIPVQCGEFMAENHEVSGIFPLADNLGELYEVPSSTRQLTFHTIRVFSPSGRSWEIPFDGYTVRRDQMDQALADQAVTAGAEIWTHTRAQKIEGDSIKTDRGTVSAKVIVGADGPMSMVARHAGLPPAGELAPAITCDVEGEFPPVVDLYFGPVAPGGYAWVIPKRGTANVGLGIKNGTGQKVTHLLEGFLRAHQWKVSGWTGGWVPSSGPAKATVSGNILLVGDAAGHVMATNGGGINLAMLCGRIAGECAADTILEGTPLTRYETEWRRVCEGPLLEGVRISRFADRFFPNRYALELAMRVLGKKRMARAIRCQPLYGRLP